MSDGKRILVTGISTYWGGRLAQALEQDPAVEAIVGADSDDPTLELQRTEFVRVSTQHALIRRVVKAAEIDTVVDTRLVVDPHRASRREAHENNVIGTLNIVAACAATDSPVRKLVFKSSAHYYGCAGDDPAFFTEDMKRSHAPATPIKRDIVEAEASVADFADKHPDVTVTTLRCCNVLGPEVDTAHGRFLALPAVPMIAGYDPRYQFVHTDDVVKALSFSVENDLPGVYNVAPDGVLALSEVIDLLGKKPLPVIPPFGTGVAVAALRRAGVVISPEMVGQLRYGRGLDNRKLKAAGFRYGHTTRETVATFGEHLRLRPVMEGVAEPYRYEKEVEDFLRWSPSVRERTREGERPALYPAGR
jgi:UDP-glucose 4-epimerase